MDTWKQKISNCHCWYPTMSVSTVSAILQKPDGFRELLNTGEKLLQDNTVHLFQTWKDSTLLDADTSDMYRLQAVEKIFDIIGRYGCTRRIYEDVKSTLSCIDVSAQVLLLEQKLISFPIVTERCTCRKKDPGLIRTQGHRAVVKWGKYPKRWKPYTTSYPLKDIDSTGLLLKMDIPQNTVEKYFHIAAQMNARITWKSLNEHKYVDFSDGVYSTHTSETPRCYNSEFINFRTSTPTNIVVLQNGFGEYFEFYNNGVLADGTENVEDLRYLSKTDIGDYVNIDKYSHTDQFRSDCSLWYAYNQKRLTLHMLKYATPENWTHVKANTKIYARKIKLVPPQTHRDRYKYWKYIKNIL